PRDDLELEIQRLGEVIGETVRERDGEQAFALLDDLRQAAILLRADELPGGRDAFAARMSVLETGQLALVARAFTLFFHVINIAEEQHRLRVLRWRDRPQKPPEGSIAAACLELSALNVPPDEVRALLARLLVMPVLTAHPTEARRRSVLDHLADIGAI